MAKKSTECCGQAQGETISRVESVLSIDERGQMILPKELRTRAHIGPGDKLAVVSHEKEGEVCCISLIKVESLTDMLREVMGPMMKDMIT